MRVIAGASCLRNPIDFAEDRVVLHQAEVGDVTAGLAPCSTHSPVLPDRYDRKHHRHRAARLLFIAPVEAVPIGRKQRRRLPDELGRVTRECERYRRHPSESRGQRCARGFSRAPQSCCVKPATQDLICGSASARPGDNADPRHPRGLLRPRCEGPSRRTAKPCDELAPPHSITSSARASSESGTARPSALAVLRLIASSIFVGAWTGNSAGFSPLKIRSM